MPNDVDVREMTDKELLQGLMATCLGFNQEAGGEVAIGKTQTQIEMCRDELSRRLSTLRSEVERLKAENAVMRELCEAADAHFGETGVSSMNYDSYIRWFGALNASRAMKETTNP